MQPLRPISYQNHVFTVGAYNTYGKAWVEERLGSRISRILEGLYNEPVNFKVAVSNSFYKGTPGGVIQHLQSGKHLQPVKVRARGQTS